VAVRVGDRAPGFTLPGTGGRDYSLAEFAGRPVVLVFYPGDDTPVCTRQLRHYTEEIGQFEGLGAQVLGIAPGSVDSKEACAAAHGFAFPLLADTDKAVAEAYGVLGPIGFYLRSVFVVDAGGVIRYAHRATAGLGFKRTDELVAAIIEAATT
jgi:thioredoxin-dependent peroxiredoxin